MERIDKILQAEVEIQEPKNPVHINAFEHEIEFRHVSSLILMRKIKTVIQCCIGC